MILRIPLLDGNRCHSSSRRCRLRRTTTWTYYTGGTGQKGKGYTIASPDHYELYEYSATYGAPTFIGRTFDNLDYHFEMTYDAEGRLNVLTYPESTSITITTPTVSCTRSRTAMSAIRTTR